MKRPLLAPLVPLYAAATWLRGEAYNRGLLSSEKLQAPVISVGNLAAGGSGKTPFVICLAQLLTRHGIAVDVLSRGYRRTTTATMQVDPDGSAADYGDEPLLIARATGVPVYVGSKRYEAGALAEKKFLGTTTRPAVHLLDDAFQHRQLSRTVDIVLVNQSDLKDSLLPAGNLREPLTALHRASTLVVRQEEQEIIPELRRRGFQLPIWLIRRTLTFPALQGPVLAFCGIARPEDFFEGLRRRGYQVAAPVTFRDHHTYQQHDADRLAALAIRHKASAFLTTEKDLIKLDSPFLRSLEQAASVHAVGLQVEILEENIVLKELLSSLGF